VFGFDFLALGFIEDAIDPRPRRFFGVEWLGEDDPYPRSISGFDVGLDLVSD
jgi:hypothetical protein